MAMIKVASTVARSPKSNRASWSNELVSSSLPPNSKRSPAAFPIVAASVQLEENFRQEYFFGYYFDRVAPIMTIFDGDMNPFGNNLKQSTCQSKALFYAICASGAVHRTHSSPEDGAMKDCALRFRMMAYRMLRREISAFATRDDSFATILILAITESWFDVYKCGLTHLQAAKYILLTRRKINKPLPPTLVHALWWLETLVAFVSDYEAVLYPSPREYLAKWTHGGPRVTSPVGREVLETDPLLGTWKPLFLHIGCLGALIQRLLRGKPTQEDKHLAEVIEMNLLEWGLPSPESTVLSPGALLSASPPKTADSGMDKPANLNTYINYAAESHRQAALLILYQHFPQLLERRARLVSNGCSPHQFLAQLAQSVVKLLKQVPFESRLWLISSIPLLCVGQWVHEAEDLMFMHSCFEMLSRKVSLCNIMMMYNVIESVREETGTNDSCSWISVLFTRGHEAMIG
ncbi:hypothetical protein AAE478_002008 [Parahypoxylon ruwenzoriense]